MLLEYFGEPINVPRGVMFEGYAGVWHRDFPKYCVQDTEKIWTHARKKIRQVALQRSSELRGSFMAQCFLLKREMLVWVDKTGSMAQILVTMLEDMVMHYQPQSEVELKL